MLRWALSAAFVVLLVAFARTVEWRATWAALAGASPRLLIAATLVNLASLVGKGAIAMRFVADVSAAATLPRVSLGLVISIVSWATQVATYHLTALAPHFPVTRAETLAILLGENAAFSVRLTPGGVGVFSVDLRGERGGLRPASGRSGRARAAGHPDHPRQCVGATGHTAPLRPGALVPAVARSRGG